MRNLFARAFCAPLARPRRGRAMLVASACLLIAACGEPEAAAEDHNEEAAHAEAAHDAGHEAGHEEGHEDVVRLPEADLRAAGVVVEQAAAGPMAHAISLPAEIGFDPDRLARISAPVGGIAREIPVSEGDHVSPGDILAVISSRDLADLKAEFLSAQAVETLARTEFARAGELFEADAVSESEYLADRADYDRAIAARAAAETKLHALGLGHEIIDRLRQADDGEHSLFRLTSPIAGRVVRRSLTLGEAIEPEEGVGQPLFVVADTGVVWADITVFEADLARVSEGDPVTLAGDSGPALADGMVSFVSPLIDPDSRTGTARAVLDNPDGALRPGQFLTARIETGAGASALRVPADAVQTVEGRQAVFTPHEDGFAPRPVATGRAADGYVEILSGLEAGEAYVAAGAFTLKAELEKSSFGDGHAH